MGVKPGYKRTEVGVIPEEWLTPTLGDLLTRVSNGLVYKPARTADYPVTRIETIADGYIDMRRVGHAEPTPEMGRYRLQQGDVLFSHINSVAHIGKVAFYDSDKPLYHGMNLLLLRAGEKLNGRYLYYWLGSTGGRHKSVSLAKQAVNQASINTSELRAIRIPLPPTKAEQEAIAEALSNADALVESLERLLAKKRQLKQGAMRELLTGKRRLPGFSGEWSSESLGSLESSRKLRLFRGKVISKKAIERSPGDYPIYSSSVTGNGTFGHYGHYMFDEELITWSVDGGGHFFHRAKHRFSVTNVCGFMRVDPQSLCCRFIAAQLQLLHGRQSFDYLVKAHPSVIRKAYELQLGPLTEQTAIAAILSDMDTDIAALEAKLAKARQIKQGMMHELLTGAIRLPVDAATVTAGARLAWRISGRGSV